MVRKATGWGRTAEVDGRGRSSAAAVAECIIQTVHLILASASPRRADLLRAAGYTFEVCVPDVDESVLEGEPARDYVERLAIAKATRATCRDPGSVALGADTTVVVDDHILAKPDDEADAARMLEMLSGRPHEVLTGVALRQGAVLVSEVVTTRVHFLQLNAAAIRWYVATGEPMGKAGAYAIQGYASRFVEAIHGSYSNVVGLPVHVIEPMWSRIKLAVESHPSRGIS